MNDDVSLRLSLLDAQIIDMDRLPVGRVDDVEIQGEPHSARVRFLLTGAQALGERIGGGTGRAVAGAAARLREDGHEPVRLPTNLVDGIEPLVRLNRRFAELPEVAGLERWLAARLIGKLPGAGDAPR